MTWSVFRSHDALSNHYTSPAKSVSLQHTVGIVALSVASVHDRPHRENNIGARLCCGSSFCPMYGRLRRMGRALFLGRRCTVL